MEIQEGVRDALILLIMNGADVYARDSDGRSATDIANDARTEWWYDGRLHLNDHLELKWIWIEALAACGYDPGEVIYRSLQAVELSDSDGDMDGDEDEDEDEYDISEAEDDDNVISHQDDENITQSQGPELSLHSPIIHEIRSLTKESTDDESREQMGPAVQGHFDWSLLEDYTNVWRL